MASRFPAVPTATPTQEEINLFCNASKSGDKNTVISYLDRFGSAIINERDNMQDTALTWAAWMGHREVVELLLDRGADINRVGMTNRSALGWAAQGGRKEVAELLLQRGAATDIRDKDGRTPRELATTTSGLEIITLIDDYKNNKGKVEAEKAERKKADEEAAALRASRLEELKKHKPPKLKF